MADKKYQKDAEFIYSNRERLLQFKKKFTEARDHYAKENSWGRAKNKAWFEDAFEHILKKYDFGQRDINTAEYAESDRGNTIVKNAFKPLSNTNIKSSEYGAALLMWMCWRTQDIAKEFYDVLNRNLNDKGKPLVFAPYLPLENNHQEEARHDRVENEIAQTSLNQQDEANNNSAGFGFLIDEDWVSSYLYPDPKPDEVWEVHHEWSPAKIRSWWLGWHVLLFGLPDHEDYKYRHAIWTGDFIRCVAQSKSVFPALFSFKIGNRQGKNLLGGHNKNDHVPHITSLNPSENIFAFCDKYCLAIVENAEEQSKRWRVFYKAAFGDLQFTDRISRHPFFSTKNRQAFHKSYFDSGQVLEADAGGKHLVFVNLARGISDVRDAMDIYRREGYEFERIEEWEGHVMEPSNILSHPTISGLFFQSFDNVKRVGGEHTQLEHPNNWNVASGRTTASWHPTQPVISIDSYKKLEDEKSEIAIFDAKTGECYVQNLTTNLLSAQAWSPDGRVIYYATKDNILTRWDLASNKTEKKFSNNSYVTRIAFSPTGNRLAVQGWDESNGIAIFETSSFELLTRFDGSFSSFRETPWHYKGRHIAYIYDGKICVRRLEFNK